MKQQVARVLQLFAFVLIVSRRPAVLVLEAPEDVHVSYLENFVAEFVKFYQFWKIGEILDCSTVFYLDRLIYKTLHILGVLRCISGPMK